LSKKEVSKLTGVILSKKEKSRLTGFILSKTSTPYRFIAEGTLSGDISIYENKIWEDIKNKNHEK